MDSKSYSSSSPKITILNSEKKFYDIENQDSINYKLRENSTHEFGLEYMQVVPSEGEVRLLGNRHRDCRYYSLGVELCKRRVIESDYDNYSPCKNAIDAMYRCYTENKYGDEYHNTIDQAKPYAKKFFNCYFFKTNSLTSCMKHFEDSIRAIYRSTDNKLIDYY
jgi:hypothetical protein